MKGANGPLPLIKRGRGFTLVELLITLAIIAIIAVIGVPMYTKYVATARQQDAKGQLAAIRQAQEIYKLQYSSYTNNTALLSGWHATLKSYTFDITAATATTFTARARGNIDGDATEDVWTIDQNGNLVNSTNDVES
jgi:type IV pilus assembly protein PilE